MTEPFPRRPRVLGSPRSVALAKEGVPPEWEPGCGAPRRRRPVGRERQPGATGHVTSRACCVSLGRDNGVIPPNTAHGSGVFDPIPAAARHQLPGVSDVGRFAPAPRRIPPPTLKPTGPRPRPRMAGTSRGPRAPPWTVALIIGVIAVLQGFHRLFGGEYSGSGCYIVVTAGREDSRGLGNPMTEPFPRRPRVLGSPRSVALAKEGVPPEWEPGCGAPRRQGSAGPGWKALAPRIALYSNASQNDGSFPPGVGSEHRPVPVRPGANWRHSHASTSSAAGSGAPRGEPLDAMGRVGILKRSGARACPNLLQRRPATGSTTRRSAEYQRFFSRAPARSGPLQQIWTNGAASGPSPRGGRRLDGDHDEHPDGRMGSRERRPAASTSLDPRARLLEVRARGSSDVLGGYPTISRTAAPAHSAPWTPRRRNVHFALESAVPTVVLECEMRVSARKARRASAPSPPAPLTPRPRQPLRPAGV